MSILKSKAQEFQDKVANAPTEPGCYLYKDSEGTIIYVGKAKNIRNRVKSYFINFPKLDIRIQNMIETATDVDFVTVDSEVESLILEQNLIKKYKTKYNIMLRDDKSYAYIKIENPVKGVRDFPRVKMVRGMDDDKAEYLGPYPDSFPIKNILRSLRRVFPYVSCNRRLVQIRENPTVVDTNNSVPCLYYHLGLCSAPCASLVSKQDYMKEFNNIKKFLKGEKKDIIRELEAEMATASKEMRYEEASQLRDKIKDIKYVTAHIRIGNDVDDINIQQIKDEERENGLKDLIAELDFPEEKLKYHENFKIECYDISNIQGTNPVGSMTVMVNGKLRPDLYRKFKIKKEHKDKSGASTPNDFAMMQEVIRRRLFNSKALQDRITEEDSENSSKIKKEDASFSVLPDLIIVDGGKGQLASAFQILKNLGMDNTIPIVGLAKREEEIFKISWQFHDSDWSFGSVGDTRLDLSSKRFKRIFLKRRTEALYLVQRIRDEAHRFGITYHRKLRSKKMLTKSP